MALCRCSTRSREILRGYGPSSHRNNSVICCGTVFCGGFQAVATIFYVGVNRLTRVIMALLLVRFAMFGFIPVVRLRQGVP